MPGLDTNLLITKDRREYYLRLISKPDDYVDILFEGPYEPVQPGAPPIPVKGALSRGTRGRN